jgi:hypothetical protein
MREEGLTHRETEALIGLQESYEAATFESISHFARVEESTRAEYLRFAGARESLAFPHGVSDSDGIEVPDEHYVFERVGTAKGPMAVFGYDYLADHYGADRTAKLALLGYQGLRGAGSEYAYEVLNFVDGKRSIAQIRDAVSAEYGPVPLEMVREYLTALESVGVIRRTP